MKGLCWGLGLLWLLEFGRCWRRVGLDAGRGLVDVGRNLRVGSVFGVEGLRDLRDGDGGGGGAVAVAESSISLFAVRPSDEHFAATTRRRREEEGGELEILFAERKQRSRGEGDNQRREWEWEGEGEHRKSNKRTRSGVGGDSRRRWHCRRDEEESRLLTRELAGDAS